MNAKRFAVVAAVILGTSASAFAETWECDYKGRWTTSETNNTGEFAWRVDWASGEAGKWAITGDYDDAYGHSYLDGTCANHTCNFSQTYKTGQLKGKVYFWTGTYKDKVESKEKTINTFVGTWGTTAADRTNGGPWSATAAYHKM